MVEKFEVRSLQETYYQTTLKNGLRVVIVPKPHYYKTYAMFTTDYGSIDRTFRPLGKKETVTVPDGIAHFLEHKMFEEEWGDVFHTFGEQGASANAYTSFTKTAYLFSSTQEIKKNIVTLLDFVQHPYFTKESVEKEKGIIAQEIRMYDDNPDWEVFFHLLRNLYSDHPVKIDIAGTTESIYEITREDLYMCYETFYHPSNMMLVIVGNVDVDEMMALVRENQEKKSFPKAEPLERIIPTEQKEAVRANTTKRMSVNTPQCLIGWKIAPPNDTGKELLAYELKMDMLLEAIFGPGAGHYEKLYEEGLIDDSFAFEFTMDRTFSFISVGGDTPQPVKLEERIGEIVQQVKENGIPKKDLERVRKKMIGSFLKKFNSLEFIANQYTRYAFSGMNIFDVVPILENMDVTDELELLHDVFDPSTKSSSYIVPKKSGEENE